MKKTTKKLTLLAILCGSIFSIGSLSSCTQNECIQCTLRGTVTVCDDSVDVFNARHGTNAQSVDDVRSLVRTLGGTCTK